ncbi:hypothetical protein, partial [Escherichia coli]|uniref:hypothetical protein n=1 Tax=Escherichia coli TaxID=562 RepID=UPI001BFD21A4
DRNRSHWSTSKTPSYTKSVSWQHHPRNGQKIVALTKRPHKYLELLTPVEYILRDNTIAIYGGPIKLI